MRVEAETQHEFELHNIGSPKLPKEGIFAGNGKLKHQANSLVNDVLQHTTWFPSKSALAGLDRPTLLFYNPYTGKVSDMKTPQQLSRQAIDEFKAIYQEEFGQSLSDDEVKEIAIRLLRFFGILVRPSTERD